ncbi:hypothetical protein FA09DRAFT_332456 [Tilletiopsis washingtonensis]|uniref:Uncharacterized protein n=1 Tax=Tilletiopsis washingtonensis TaxID=58919 RepID=A0A316Z299_9BASI|nr:hypothetical protein FA09DRAFT_332456 [Tilletiopsis washingtonensis]PWN95042.1 hypothetical protein FA09DRAFT_332456 [Tilletiopsis washingtonensis]
MGYVTVGARGRQTAIARWVTKNADALATSFNTERLERSGLQQQDGKWVANEELLLAIERFNAHFKKRYGVKKTKHFVAAAQEHTLDFLERALMLQPNGWAKMGLGAACMPTARLCSDGFRLRWDYCDLRRPKYWCMSKEAAKADGRYRPGEPVWDECSEVVDAQKGTLWWRRLQLLTASTGRQGPALLVSSLPHGQDFAGDSKSRTSADQGGLGGECSPACSSGQCADPAQARPALSAHRRRLPRRMRPGARCTTSASTPALTTCLRRRALSASRRARCTRCRASTRTPTGVGRSAARSAPRRACRPTAGHRTAGRWATASTARRRTTSSSTRAGSRSHSPRARSTTTPRLSLWSCSSSRPSTILPSTPARASVSDTGRPSTSTPTPLRCARSSCGSRSGSVIWRARRCWSGC